MLALLSIIALAFATEYDVLYTENLYAEETDCVDERYWLCYFCQSNITYTVDATQEFQIKGLLQSDLELIYQIYDDLEKYVTGDEYTLALGNNKTCLAIGRISNDPDLTLMFQELMEVEYTSQDLAFVTDVPVMNQVLVNTQKGVSYDYYLEQLLVDFDSDSTATYLDSIKLDISQKRINLYQYYGYLEYLGDVEAGDASLAATFAVSVPYTSESLGIFEVTINVDAEYTLEEWTDNIAASYECSEIQSPKGLDYLQLLPVMFTVLRIDNTNNSLLNTIVYLGVPDFAITTGVELTILTGALYIADNECDVSFSGLWYTETGLELDIEFHAGKEENYKGQAYLANDPRQVNLLDLETLMGTLYFDSNPILPQYSLEGDLRNRLYTTIIHNPAFDIEFDTEMIVSLEGTGQIIDFEDSYIEIDFRRFETVIESFIYYTQVTNQALNVLHDFEWIENDGLFITNGQITSATTDTTLEDGTAVTPGILLEATLKLNTHCYDLEFCSLISKGLNISITTMNSTYYPTDFYYEVPLRDLNMSSLQLYSNSYFLYFQPEKVQFIKNSFDIQGDYDSKLTFEGNITSVSGDAYLRSKLNAKWESVLNISTFAIPLLEISANINLKNVLNSTVQGRGQFEDTESTWPGDVLVSLNVNDYDNNFFIAVMYPTTPETFFKFLALRASLDPILQSFNFSAGANLEYSLRDYDYLSQGFYVYGSTKFLGLIAHFETRFLEITDSMTMKVSMPGFPCAFGNILVLPVNNTFNLALEIDPVSSSGNLTAMFAL